MSEIILKHQTAQGKTIQATFLSDCGMNLCSFRKGDIEVIDQSTWVIFEERYAGLGALIGPHFHRRATSELPIIAEENLFPHIARVKAKGVADPFSHGIARYAPWNIKATKNSIHATLSGMDKWHGVLLKHLEGQNFDMQFDIHLGEYGLDLELAVASEKASVVGIHYYYCLPNGKGRVLSDVQSSVGIDGIRKTIPSTWKNDGSPNLIVNLDQSIDATFHPPYNSTIGNIWLETDDYVLRTNYVSDSTENCWQLYHPTDASFVCIEPLSAADPRHPRLSVSRLAIHLEISASQRNE